jgi:CheY-like chemotaxis protein
MAKVALIVDDESSIRAYIKTALEDEGFNVLEAPDGRDALDTVHKLGGKIDLVVSDIKMPRMDGLTLARAVRSEFPATPIVLISGFPDVHQENGEQPFTLLKKPFLPSVLLETVRSVVRV